MTIPASVAKGAKALFEVPAGNMGAVTGAATGVMGIATAVTILAVSFEKLFAWPLFRRLRAGILMGVSAPITIPAVPFQKVATGSGRGLGMSRTIPWASGILALHEFIFVILRSCIIHQLPLHY